MLDKTSFVLPAIAHDTWEGKYRWKQSDGTPLDLSISDTWRRVAHQLAEPEQHDNHMWEERFYGLLESHRFLPAGRILSGAGTGMKTTLFNCFVMGEIDDSMEGILQAHTESMLSLRMGGGVGNDFSSIRPHGAPVYGVNSTASGPLTFMDIWDTACRTLMGAGARRGAMMATLRCNHPDVEAFVDAKLDETRFRNFNLSVTVTDQFMIAVERDLDWPLEFGGTVYKTIRARDLWNKIMQNTYDSAEPGVIFIDRVNQMNNLWYCETISSTNPCGEQPLPPYGACLLGSLNLPAFVKDPFTDRASISLTELQEAIALAVRMLDNVIDVSKYPLPQQREEAINKRRIGLGVTGLANALAMCKRRYGTEQAAVTVERWMKEISEAAYDTSISLAKEKGAFPLFNAEKYLQGEFISKLPGSLRSKIEHQGIRNALLTSIAPTGTISLFAGNLSSGVEPTFAYEYSRKVLQNNGERATLKLRDYAYGLYREQFANEGEELPDYFVTAQELTPVEHLRMLASVQKYVDSSVSKTVNVPKEISFEAFKDVYQRAYELGIKACSTYRPNDITGAVLELDTQNEKETNKVLLSSGEFTGDPSLVEKYGPETINALSGTQSDVAPQFTTTAPERPPELPGMTYKIVWPHSDHAMYVTVNDKVVNGQPQPYEVFINTKNMSHYAWVVALTRMISAIFRRGGDVRFVVEELKAVFDPQGGAWVSGDGPTRYSPSLLAEIGTKIEKHMIDSGYMAGPVLKAQSLDDVPAGVGMQQCPKCGGATVIKQEGCDKCLACDYSKCG